MATLAPLALKLTADISGLTSGMSKAQSVVSNAAAGMERSFVASAQRIQQSLRNMSDALTGFGAKMSLAVTAPIVGFATMALKGAMANEQLEVSFTTMLGSAEKAKKMMADLATFAAATPFETPEIQNASKMLLAFGVAAEDVIPTMTTLGDIASGLNIPLGDLAYLFGTTRASGRLMTADLNQFTSRGIPMIAALAKTLGIAESEVKGFVEAGKVGFPEVQAALLSLTTDGGQFAGLMEAQSKTLAGLLSTASDNVGLTMTAIGQQISEGFDLQGKLDKFNAGLGKAKDAVVNFAKTQPELFKLILVFVGIVAAIGPLLVALGALLGVLANLAPLLPVLAAGFAALTGPIGLVAAALIALVALDVGGIQTKIGAVTDSLKEWLGISDQIEGQSIQMGAAIGKMSPAMQSLQRAIAPVIKAWDAWRDALARAEGATGRMESAVQTERFVKLPDPSLIDRVAQAFVKVRDAIAGLMKGDTSGIQAIFNSIRDAVSNINLPSISEVWEMAKVEITTVVKNLTWDVPGDVFNGLKTAVMDQLRSLWENIFGGGGPLKGVESRNLPDFGMRAESIFAGALKGNESAAGIAQKSLFDPLIDFVMGQLATIDWSTLATNTAEGAGNMFEGVKGFVQSQLSTIDWSTLAAGTGEKAGNIFDGVKGFVQEQLSGVDWSTASEDTLTKLQTGAKTLKGLVLDTIADTPISIDATKITSLQSTLDAVKPVFDQLFGEEGIITTINATINEGMIAMGERLEKTDGAALGEQFTQTLTQVAGLVTMFEGMKVEGSAERANAIIQLGTDVLNFLSDFGSGIDPAGLATSIGGLTKTISGALDAAFSEENVTELGAAAGRFAGTLVGKIGEFLGTPNFGSDLGESAGKTVGTLAKAAMNLVTGIVTELGKVNWGEVGGDLQTFVTGFISGITTGLAEADMGPVATGLLDAIVRALTENVPDLPLPKSMGEFLFGSQEQSDAVATGLADLSKAAGGWLADQAAAIVWPEIPMPAWIETLRNLLGGGAGSDDPFGFGFSFDKFKKDREMGPESPFAKQPDWLTKFKWPELPVFTWPDYLTFTWPSYLTFKWPSYPTFSWPSTPGWVTSLIDALNNFSLFPSTNAAGTSYFHGGLSWVGEQGPELMALPRGTRIWNNRESEAMAADSASPIIIQSMVVRSDADIQAFAYQVDDLRRRWKSRRS